MRTILNALAALSLMLAVLVAALWVRGYRWYDDLGVVTTYKTPDYRRDRQYQFGSEVGGITWTITTYEWTTPKAVAGAWMPEGTSFWRNVLEAQPRRTFIVARDGFGGFNVSRDSSAAFDPDKIYSWRKMAVRTPVWFILAVVATPAIIRFVAFYVARLKRKWRRRSGLCPACGYDLRASSGLCPECGMLPAIRPAA